VLLPPLLFEGAATTDLESLRENLLTVLVLAVPGLIVSVVLLGAISQYVLGLPLLLALLFGAMVLPTDPVSVLALFEEVGAPERLSTLVEGESLVNDGESTVEQREEGYEEFWRSQAAEFGIDFDIDTADVDGTETTDD